MICVYSVNMIYVDATCHVLSMEPNERLRKARLAAGYTSARSAAVRHSWGVSTYAAHENGQNGFDPEVAALYARAFRTTASWLLTGEGEAKRDRVVAIMGRIGAGARIEPDFEQVPIEGFRDVESLVPIPPDAIGFEVVGGSMIPRYDEGDVIVCLRQGIDLGSIGDGEEVAIRSVDGERFLKRIYREETTGLYTLISHNADPILHVRIEWVSDVQNVIRKSKWREMTRADRARLARLTSPSYRAAAE